jgi:NAD(P)-dependent dehydrogenase (short-subunit alcohol dehydrogenase family)
VTPGGQGAAGAKELPGEIAPAIVWLLGPEAGYATGAVLRVAGGV